MLTFSKVCESGQVINSFLRFCFSPYKMRTLPPTTTFKKFLRESNDTILHVHTCTQSKPGTESKEIGNRRNRNTRF